MQPRGSPVLPQGNSGGPLLNELGEAIGIVTAKAGGMHTEGLGFAIPMAAVLRVLPYLLRGQSIQHPMLGMQLCDEVRALGLQQPSHCLGATRTC